jgi:hypothetical protein
MKWVDMPDPKSRAPRARTTVADLVDAGVLAAGDALYFSSTRVTITAGGQLQAADGRQFASPTDAATVLSGSIRNGWDCWRVGGASGVKIKELRRKFEQARSKSGGEPTG